MRRLFLLLFFPFLYFTSSSQDLSGQWKGEFVEKSSSFNGWGGERCDYVIDIDCKGKKVTGSSYTYFTESGRRYYTICQLEGTYDANAMTVEFREIKRTKTNVPIEIRNCFQIHKLSFSKGETADKLTGTWSPAPNQDGNCGFGTTSLERRKLSADFPGISRLKTPATKLNPRVNSTATAKAQPVTKPGIKSSGKAVVTTKPVNATKPAIVKATPPATASRPLTPNFTPMEIPQSESPAPVSRVATSSGRFEKRNTSLLKTIPIDNPTVKVELYDNGEIDGDSISLFYNNKLLLSHKRLTDKAITLTIDVDPSNDVNELMMYADNLGTIPPNTALMVVTDGTKRYEVRITSDLQRNGTIRFVPRNKWNSN